MRIIYLRFLVRPLPPSPNTGGGGNSSGGGTSHVLPNPTSTTMDMVNFNSALSQFKNWYQENFGNVNITSGIRTTEENNRVGGAKNSLHLKGLAVDFSLPSGYSGWSKERKDSFWNQLADQWGKILSKFTFSSATSGFGSVERTNTHVHLDTGFSGKTNTWLWGDSY